MGISICYIGTDLEVNLSTPW